MQLTPEEAQEALREIEASRRSFRRAISVNKGYQHLWLWGAVWVVLAMLGQFAALIPGWVNLACNVTVLVGVGGSWLIGWSRRRHVRNALDRRFLTALLVVVIFGVFVWPTLLGHSHGHATFAYPALITMQAYLIAGLWYDNHLFWVGLISTALLLVGYLFVAIYFWWWVAIFGGGTLIFSGFYVRHSWR